MTYYMYPQPTNGRASSNDFSVNTWLSKFYENGSSSIFIYSTGISSWGETYFPQTISDNLNSCCVISISIRQASQVLSTTFESLARHQTTKPLLTWMSSVKKVTLSWLTDSISRMELSYWPGSMQGGIQCFL